MSATSTQWKDKGNNYFKDGDFAKAIECYTKAIQLDSSNAVLYSNRCAALMRQQNWKSALSDANQALSLDPKQYKALLRKIQILKAMGDKEELFHEIAKGMDLGDSMPAEFKKQFLQEISGQDTVMGLMSALSNQVSPSSKIGSSILPEGNKQAIGMAFQTLFVTLKTHYFTVREAVNQYWKTLSEDIRTQLFNKATNNELGVGIRKSVVEFFAKEYLHNVDKFMELVTTINYLYDMKEGKGMEPEDVVMDMELAIKDKNYIVNIAGFTRLVQAISTTLNKSKDGSVYLQLMEVFQIFSLLLTETTLLFKTKTGKSSIAKSAKQQSKMDFRKKKERHCPMCPSLIDTIHASSYLPHILEDLKSKLKNTNATIQTRIDALQQLSCHEENQFLLDEEHYSLFEEAAHKQPEIFFEIIANIAANPEFENIEVTNYLKKLMNLLKQVGKAGQDTCPSNQLARVLGNIAFAKDSLALQCEEFLINLRQGLKEECQKNHPNFSLLVRAVACFATIPEMYDPMFTLGFAKYLDTLSYMDRMDSNLTCQFAIEAKDLLGGLLHKPSKDTNFKSKYMLQVEDELFNIEPQSEKLVPIPPQLYKSLSDPKTRKNFVCENFILQHADVNGIGKLIRFVKHLHDGSYASFIFQFHVIRNNFRDCMFANHFSDKEFDGLFDEAFLSYQESKTDYRSFAVITKEEAIELIDILTTATRKQRSLEDYEEQAIKSSYSYFGKKPSSKYTSIYDFFFAKLQAKIPSEEQQMKKTYGFYRNAYTTCAFHNYFLNTGDCMYLGAKPKPYGNFQPNHSYEPVLTPTPRPVKYWITETAQLIANDVQYVDQLASVFLYQAFVFERQGNREMSSDLFASVKHIKEWAPLNKLHHIPCVRALLERSVYFGSPHMLPPSVVTRVFRTHGLKQVFCTLLEAYHDAIPVRYNLRYTLQDVVAGQLADYLIVYREETKRKQIDDMQILRDFIRILTSHKEVNEKTAYQLTGLILPHVKSLYDEVAGEITSKSKEINQNKRFDFMEMNSMLTDYYQASDTNKLKFGKRCHYCGKDASKQCSRCKSVWYCSKECQVTDWRTHKQNCVPVEK